MGGGISTATTQIPEDILINLQKASSLIKANTEESLKIILNISRNAENNQYLCLPELGILPLLVNNIKKERNNSNDLYYPLAILSNITNSSHTNNFLLQSVSELGLIQLLLTIIYDGKGDFRLYSCLILLHLSLRVEIISLITNTNRTSIHHSHGSHSSYSPSRSHSNDYSVVNSTNNRANNSNSNSHVSSNQSHETGRNTSQTHSVVTNSNIQILLDVVKNDVGDTRSYCINIFYNIAKHGSHNDNYEVYKNNVHVAVITLLFNNGPNKSAWEHPKSITNSLNFLLYFSVYNFTKISIREEGLLELLVEMYTITNNDNGYRKKALLIMLLLYGMEENSNPVLKPILSHLSDGINYVIILLKDLLDGQLLIENNQEEVITLLLVLKVCYFLSLSDSNKTKLVSSPLVLLLGRILDSYMINDTSILITVTNLNNSHSHSHSHSNSHSHGTPVINGISDISTGITTTFHNNHSDIFSDHGINSNTPESMLTRATEISIEILIQLSFSYEEDYLLQTQLMTPEMGFLELFQGILKKRSLNENTLINTKLMCQRLEPVPSIVISSKNSIHSSINTVSVIRNKIMILTSHSKSSRIDLVNGLSANLKQKKYDVHINQRCVLDSSSFALASAAVVIICISRDFKTDPKCRLEALKVEKLHKSSLKSTESADSHKIAGNPDGVTRSPSYSIDATNCLQHVLFVYTQADYTLATVPEHCDGWLEGLLLRYQQRNRNGNNNGRRSRTNSFDDNDNHRTPRSARSNNSSQNTSLSTVGMRATKLRNNGEIPGFPLWDADCIDSTTRIIVDIIGDCGKVVDIEEKSDVSEAMNTKVDTASNDHHKNSPVNIADEIPREDFAKSLPSESITLKSPIPIDIGENSGSSITSKESLASPYVGTHSSPINGQLDRTNGLPVRATSEDQPIDSRMQSTPTAIGLQSTDNLVRPSSRDKTHLLHDVSAPLLSYEYADDRPVQSKYKARGSSAGSRRGSESSAGSRPEIEKLLGEESSAHRALTTSEIDYNNAWVALHSESKVTDLSKVNQKLNDYGVMEAAELAELDKEDIEQLATLFKKAQRRKFLMIFHM